MPHAVAIEIAIKAKELIIALIVIFGWLSEPFTPDVVISYSHQEFFADAPPNSDAQTIFELLVDNKSGELVSDVELSVLGVSDVQSLSYKTSSKRLAESIGEKIEYQITKEGMYISDLKSIPPGHNINIQILSTYRDPMFSSPIDFSSSAESEYISGRRYVAGAWVFAYEWSYIWIPIVLMVLVLLAAYRIFPLFNKELEG
ncbi:hypothetical protein [Marinobacter adhaerens]|uniref:hypothetical protein n=1 Tax=Marinobacter adhaerens TaxID=1033846 RepID=UPI003F71D0F3